LLRGTASQFRVPEGARKIRAHDEKPDWHA
jgi:hypothetical protein